MFNKCICKSCKQESSIVEIDFGHPFEHGSVIGFYSILRKVTDCCYSEPMSELEYEEYLIEQEPDKE